MNSPESLAHGQHVVANYFFPHANNKICHISCMKNSLWSNAVEECLLANDSIIPKLSLSSHLSLCCNKTNVPSLGSSDPHPLHFYVSWNASIIGYWAQKTEQSRTTETTSGYTKISQSSRQPRTVTLRWCFFFSFACTIMYFRWSAALQHHIAWITRQFHSFIFFSFFKAHF